MKKFISGFAAGAIIFSTIGTFAVSYVAEQAPFKVLVNGKEFTSDPPAMVINDRTYLPLRAIGDALGVPVNWNEELRQAEVGTSPQAEEPKDENNDIELKTGEILTKKTDVTYKENPAILNLGYILKKDAYQVKTSNGYIVYCYDVSDEIGNPVRQYEYILKNNGFTVSYSNNELDAYYSKDILNTDYSIYAMADDEMMIVSFKDMR